MLSPWRYNSAAPATSSSDKPLLVTPASGEAFPIEINVSEITNGTPFAVLSVGAGGLLSQRGPLTNGQLLIGSTGAAAVAASLTAGAGITITPGAGSITIASDNPTDNLIIGTTPITSGTAGRILFEGAGNVVQEDADLSFDGLQLALATQGNTGGVLIGGDAQIYRSAADVLRTPDSIIVDSNLTVASLTNTRIPFAGAGGLLQDDADLTFTGGNTLTVHTATVTTGNLSVNSGNIQRGSAAALSLMTDVNVEQMRLNHTASTNTFFTVTGGNSAAPTIGSQGTSGGSLSCTADLTIIAPASALAVNSSNSGNQNQITASNSSNTAGSHGVLRSAVAGGSAGDPFYHMIVNGVSELAIGLDNSDSDQFVWSNSSGLGTNNRMKMSLSGSFQFSAYGAGTLTTDASGNITAISDIHQKRDVKPFSAGLETILQINPIEYGYAPATGLDQSRTDYVGFNANEIETLIPQAVGHNNVDANKITSHHLTLNQGAILAAAVNAIKQLDTRMKAANL